MAPVGPFSFIEEDKGGESPKVVVRDARGHEWTVKLGPEAQAETVSTRLVWFVGYFAEEAYYLDEARIKGLPRLSGGQDYVSGDTVRGARFEPKRSGMKRGPTWSWHDNPFENTPELSGLKVLMILLNNFDARSENNRLIYVDGPRGMEARYYVTDLVQQWVEPVDWAALGYGPQSIYKRSSMLCGFCLISASSTPTSATAKSISR
jgi:hypothetical protein